MFPAKVARLVVGLVLAAAIALTTAVTSFASDSQDIPAPSARTVGWQANSDDIAPVGYNYGSNTAATEVTASPSTSDGGGWDMGSGAYGYDDRSRVARASAPSVSYRSGPRAAGSAFHHTTNQAVESIMRSGLRPGSYATPTRGLSPLQAHIELALNPAGAARNAVLQIDVAGLRAAGYEIPAVTRVTGAYGMASGGWEMRFPYKIPTAYLKVIP